MRIALFRIFLLLGLCYSGFSTSAAVAPFNIEDNCNLPAPTNLYFASLMPTSADAGWDPVTGAAAYWVTVVEQASGNTVYTNSVLSPYASATGLTPATAYFFNVQAIDPGGCISPNMVTRSFQTGIIVVDDLIASLQAPEPVHCNMLTPIQAGIPTIFGIKDGETYIHFNVVLESGQYKVLHENMGCATNPNSCYAAGWHFSADNALPPMNRGLVEGLLLHCYKFVSDTDASNFNPNSPTLILNITIDGGQATVCPVFNPYAYGVCRNGRTGARSNFEAVSSDTTIRVSPNPFSQWLAIDLEMEPNDQGEIVLFDVCGRCVLLHPLLNAEKQVQLSTDALVPGAYWLRIRVGQEIRTVSVLKMD